MLEKVLEDKLGVVEILMEIQKAGAYYHKTNPAKAAKFFQYVGSLGRLSKRAIQKRRIR